jgi:hypothetical protein
LNFEETILNILTSTTATDPRIATILFLICAIGEFGFGIPYVLEAVWLLAGYQMGAGLSSPGHLLWLLLFTQLGRQAGAFIMYRLCRFGSTPLHNLYQRLHLERVFHKITARTSFFSRINLTSTFSVAYGRLFGLRMPMALALAMKRDPKTLAVGVLISGIIFDVLYAVVGMIFGATISIKPIYMLLASMAGLTVIYILTLACRYLIRHARQKQAAESCQN